jgi:hypothetical protein
MSKGCIICYFPIETLGIKCSSISCLSEICLECLESYINIYELEKKGIPKCPTTGCISGEILHSQISKINNKGLLEKYENLCVNHLKNINLDDILSEINIKKITEKIRKDKHEFILKEFPISISFIIEKCLKSKLSSIDKKNKEHIKKAKSNKRCPNILCYSGILDIDFRCLSCTQQFCIKCEIKIEEDKKHSCKQEDLDSLKKLESLVKCPKCKFPVEKMYGCNNITCSVCKTNFDYITGKITIAGNHSNDTLVLRNFNKPSISFRDNYDSKILNLLRQVENYEPQSYKFSNVLCELKKYISLENEDCNQDQKELKSLISNKYELYKQSQYKNQNYFKIIILIQKHHEQKKLNKEVLENIIKVLEMHY